MKDRNCVWVLELNIATARGKPSSTWIVWTAFNTRREAVKAREENGPKPRTMYRIRKYVPRG